MTAAQEIEIMLSSVRCPKISVGGWALNNEYNIKRINWKGIARNLIPYVDLLNSKSQFMANHKDTEEAYSKMEATGVLWELTYCADIDIVEYNSVWIDFYKRAKQCHSWLSAVLEYNRDENGKAKVSVEGLYECLDAFVSIQYDLKVIINHSVFPSNFSFKKSFKKNISKSSKADNQNKTVCTSIESSDENEFCVENDEKPPSLYLYLNKLQIDFRMDEATAKDFIDYCRQNKDADSINNKYRYLMREDKARKRAKRERSFIKPLFDILKANDAVKGGYSNFQKLNWN